MESFDLIVIGTGSAATSVIYPCREAGWNVAAIDNRPFGGTCANRGCDPKKVLVGVAAAVDQARRFAGKGYDGSANVDWPALMRFKRTFTDPVPSSREKQFAESGIVAFHGTAKFRDPETIEVGDSLLTAKYFVVAAGAAPVKLGIEGEKLLLTSDDFLELDRLPESLVFVGGGYIAFEFAHLARRVGSKVTILHRGKCPLEQFDGDLVNDLVELTRRTGIDVRVEMPVDRITEGVVVHAKGDQFRAEAAIHAAGRVPQVELLNLPAANVQADKRGVVVNEFLQSPTNSRVYAVGDVAASGGPALTPVVGYEGRIVAENLLNGNRAKPDYRGVASTVFSMPPLAMVGLTEEAAIKQGIAYERRVGDTTSWYSYRRLAAEKSSFKILIEKGSKRILGAHIMGEGSEDLINLFSLAIKMDLTADQLQSPLYAYPTHGSDIQYML